MATGVDAKLLKWIASKISDILGSEDDVVIELCFNLIEGPRFPDIKALQIQLTGFLDKDTAPFCRELWKLFLSAQTSPQGVPKELLEAKKLELIQEKMEADRAADEARRRRGDIDRRQQDGPAPRDRDRGERGRGRGGGGDMWRGRNSDRDYDQRGTVIRGTEAHSVGPLETAMSQGIAVSAAECLAVVATTRALRLRHPPPHGRAAPIASGTRVVAHPRPPPDELVENAAYPAPGVREIDRCHREGARAIIANREGKGDLHEALRRPQHRLISGRLQSAADTPHHGAVHQVVRDDPAVEARTQRHLVVLDPAAVTLRVELLGDVQVRDLGAAPDTATIAASLALQIPTVAEEQLMTSTRLIERSQEARERMRQKKAEDALDSLAAWRSADSSKR
ncbi:PWI domain-containing protein [Colletotrichum acutatum]